MKYKLSCLCCGKAFETNNSNKKTCSDACSKELQAIRVKNRRKRIREAAIKAGKIKERVSYKDSLCWFCKNSVIDGCSWSREFVPVNGWDATETSKKSYSSSMSKSYNVTSCPEFVRG